MMATDRRVLALAPTLVTAQLVVMLDSSILNVALSSVATEFGLTSTATAWVLNAYFLAYGGLLLISGRAADICGRRRMFLIGAATLAVGSLLGMLAPAETLEIVRASTGQAGPNSDYVRSTVGHLRMLGIRDPLLEWLAARLEEDAVIPP